VHEQPLDSHAPACNNAECVAAVRNEIIIIKKILEKLHNEDLHNLYPLPNTAVLIKVKRLIRV
jgi:hypothetical protein